MKFAAKITPSHQADIQAELRDTGKRPLATAAARD
jgi:hypothetical protein